MVAKLYEKLTRATPQGGGPADVALTLLLDSGHLEFQAATPTTGILKLPITAGDALALAHQLTRGAQQALQQAEITS